MFLHRRVLSALNMAGIISRLDASIQSEPRERGEAALASITDGVGTGGIEVVLSECGRDRSDFSALAVCLRDVSPVVLRRSS